MSLLLLFLRLVPDFSGLDPKVFEVMPIDRLDSPSTVLIHQGALYLGADLLASKPGVYRMQPGAESWRANLVHHLPQQEVQGVVADGDFFHVASSRLFSNQMADWQNNYVVIDHPNRNVVDRIPLEISNLCGDGKPQCGVVGVIPIDPTTLIVVTKQRLARIYVLKFADKVWTAQIVMPVTMQGRYPVITEVKRYQDKLVFLLQDRWMLAEGSLKKLLEGSRSAYPIKEVFRFEHLRHVLKPKQSKLSFTGFVEGFDVDLFGNLYLVCNNKLWPWRNSPDEVLDRRPKLIIYRPQAAPKSPSPSP